MPIENLGINLDKVIAEFGEKCQDPDVKKDFIAKTFYNPNLMNRFEIVDGVLDEIPIVNATFDDPLAPMPDAGNITFKQDLMKVGARVIKTKPIVLATKIVPRNLLQNYLTLINKENYKRNVTDPFYVPFMDFFTNGLIDAASESLYLKALFKGVNNPAGTTSADLFDGYLKTIADEITASNVTPVATGAITSTNVIEKLQMVYDAMGEEQKGKKINMHVNSKIFDWVTRSYGLMTNRSVMVKDVADAALAQPLQAVPLDGTNAILYREPGLGTSQRVTSTVAGNAHLGYYGKPESMDFEIQKENLTLKLIMTFKAGANFATVDDVFQNFKVNNQN